MALKGSIHHKVVEHGCEESRSLNAVSVKTWQGLGNIKHTRLAITSSLSDLDMACIRAGCVLGADQAVHCPSPAPIDRIARDSMYYIFAVYEFLDKLC